MKKLNKFNTILEYVVFYLVIPSYAITELFKYNTILGLIALIIVFSRQYAKAIKLMEELKNV